MSLDFIINLSIQPSQDFPGNIGKLTTHKHRINIGLFVLYSMNEVLGEKKILQCNNNLRSVNYSKIDFIIQFPSLQSAVFGLRKKKSHPIRFTFYCNECKLCVSV